MNMIGIDATKLNQGLQVGKGNFPREKSSVYCIRRRKSILNDRSIWNVCRAGKWNEVKELCTETKRIRQEHKEGV